MANGLAGNEVILDTADPDFVANLTALTDLCAWWPRPSCGTVKGATKFITLGVDGAESDADAHRTPTPSPPALWSRPPFMAATPMGRILAAAGYAGVEILFLLVTLPLPVMGAFTIGGRGPPTDYAETDAAAIFAQAQIQVFLFWTPAETSPVRPRSGPAT